MTGQPVCEAASVYAWLHVAVSDMTRAAVGQQRSVVIGNDAFTRLKLVQNTWMPSPPRLDMRYLIDGAVALVAHHDDTTIRSEWMARATEALIRHVRSTQASASRAEGGNAHRAQERSEQKNTRADDGKSVHIDEACFQMLKTLQGTTREPRLGIRYLAEGALDVLLQRREALLGAWVYLARQALSHHLVSLQQQQLTTLEFRP